jgi:hypothetical protein
VPVAGHGSRRSNPGDGEKHHIREPDFSLALPKFMHVGLNIVFPKEVCDALSLLDTNTAVL